MQMIELYDNQISDIIPDEYLQNNKYIRIKKLIERIVPKEMKVKIDKMLTDLGYKGKTQGNQGYIMIDGKPTIGTKADGLQNKK